MTKHRRSFRRCFIDGNLTKRPFRISEASRSEHGMIIGKTGTGKTHLIKSLLAQDIAAERGFLGIDLHGDLTPFILSRIAEREHRTATDLSRRLVIVDPTHAMQSVAMNVSPKWCDVPLAEVLGEDEAPSGWPGDNKFPLSRGREGIAAEDSCVVQRLSAGREHFAISSMECKLHNLGLS